VSTWLARTDARSSAIARGNGKPISQVGYVIL